ncbi:MAG: nucleotidyltransferase family protein [Vicinamibacterales bacterium]
MRRRSDVEAPGITVALLARVLAGDAAAWHELDRVGADEVCRVARAHGVLPLVADLATRHVEVVGNALASALHDHAQREAAIDLVRQPDLEGLCEHLAAAGVAPLLIKGAHLAYHYYERPDLRPRLDTDLLIEPTDRAAAVGVLTALGYEPSAQTEGDLVMYQEPYTRRRGSATTHVVDVHWRISNAQRFATFLTCREIRAAAVPLVRLPWAVAPSAVHALLLACVHRVAHHLDAARLIWSYDLHVIGATLSPVDWGRFETLAVERGIAGTCLRSLRGAEQLFGTHTPAAVIGRLTAASHNERDAGVYVAERPHIHRIVEDFRSLGSWNERYRLACQHLFPAPAYMRGVYAPSSRVPLPLLYVRRAVLGARRWLRRA